MNTLKTYAPFLAILFAPGFAFAAPQTWSDLVALVVLVVNVATPMLVALTLVVFLGRTLLAMTGVGGDKKGISAERIRQTALYGIGIIFVMVSIWGILNLLDTTFFSGASSGGGGAGSNVTNCTGLGNC